MVPSKFLPGQVAGLILFFEALSSSLGSIGSKGESWEKNVIIILIIEIIIALTIHTINIYPVRSQNKSEYGS